jgi:hypothetical protein
MVEPRRVESQMTEKIGFLHLAEFQFSIFFQIVKKCSFSANFKYFCSTLILLSVLYSTTVLNTLEWWKMKKIEWLKNYKKYSIARKHHAGRYSWSSFTLKRRVLLDWLFLLVKLSLAGASYFGRFSIGIDETGSLKDKNINFEGGTPIKRTKKDQNVSHYITEYFGIYLVFGKESCCFNIN